MRFVAILSILFCSGRISAQSSHHVNEDQTASICKELCLSQRKCRSIDSTACISCRGRCKNRLNGDVENLGLDPDTLAMIRRLVLLKATVYDDDPLWSTPEISKLLDELMKKISDVDHHAEEDAEEMSERETLRNVCEQLCTSQGECAIGKKCGMCKKDCMNELAAADEKLSMEHDTLQALDVIALHNKGQPLWASPYVVQLMKVVRKKLKDNEKSEKFSEKNDFGDSKEQRTEDETMQQICNMLCELQQKCDVDDSACLKCKKKCLKAIDSELNIDLDEDTKLMIHRLILIAATAEDEFIWQETQMQRLLLVLLTKLEDSLPESRENTDKEHENSAVDMNQICTQLCKLQQSCKTENQCNSCKTDCAKGIVNEAELNLDEETRLMLRRLLLVAATTKDESIWDIPEVRRLLLVMMAKLEDSQIIMESAREENVDKANRNKENEDTLEVCDNLCKLQHKCEADDSGCEQCRQDCLTGIYGSKLEIVLDEDTQLMIRRLLLVAATAEDESIWQKPQMQRLLLILMTKLKEAEAKSLEEPEKAKPDENSGSQGVQTQEDGIAQICVQVCKLQSCKTPEACETCEKSCLRGFLDETEPDLDEDTRLMLQRLLLVSATTKDKSVWETSEMQRLLLVLMKKLQKNHVKPEPTGGQQSVDEGTPTYLANGGKNATLKFKRHELHQVCEKLCNMRAKCDQNATDDCRLCVKRCISRSISNLDFLDDETRMMLHRLVLIASTTEGKSVWDKPEMKRLMLVLMTKIQAAEKASTQQKEEKAGVNPTTSPALPETVASKAIDSELDIDLDEDTKLMIQRLILIAATTEDESIWQETQIQRLLLVLLTKLDDSLSESRENTGSDKKLENSAVGMNRICTQLCKLQQSCKRENQCKSCKTNCAKGIMNEAELNLDEETRLMLRRLLLVAATTKDESIWDIPEVHRLLLVMMAKLEEAQTILESTREENVDKANRNEENEDTLKVCDNLCKLQHKCEADDSGCKQCRQDCLTGIYGSKLEIVLDEDTQLMIRRLLLVAAAAEDESIWQKPQMQRLLLVLMTKLKEAEAKSVEEPEKAKPDENSGSQGVQTQGDSIAQICVQVCKLQSCKTPEACETCEKSCLKESMSDLDFFDDETRGLLYRLVLIASTTEGESVWDKPEMKRLMLVLMTKIQAAEKASTQQKEKKAGINPTTSPALPKSVSSKETPKSILRRCNVGCSARCIPSLERRKILKPISNQCRTCVRNRCGTVKMYNADCAFEIMELQCARRCPTVSQEIKSRVDDCSACQTDCRRKERTRQRGAM